MSIIYIMGYKGFCFPKLNFVDYVIFKSAVSNKFLKTREPSVGSGVWVLQGVYYVSP